MYREVTVIKVDRMVGGAGRVRAASFPVIFFNGERETDVGDVEIYQELEYKHFQMMLSQKIGISPNQISTYLVNWKNSSGSPLSWDLRRTPITSKVDFGSVCSRRECCFLVILKRSRKSKNRRGRLTDDGVVFSPKPKDVVLLTRVPGAKTLYDTIAPPDISDCGGQLRSFVRGFTDPPILSSEKDLDLEPDYNLNLLQAKIDRSDAFCKQCLIAKRMGKAAQFHPCVEDPVITRFTTRLGPINRPSNPLP